MSGYVEQGEVVRNEQIGSDVWIMDVHAPKQAAEAKVGQFCNVRVAILRHHCCAALLAMLDLMPERVRLPFCIAS